VNARVIFSGIYVDDLYFLCILGGGFNSHVVAAV
jgi:hypothetical protein